jgi:hypothetical protein
MRAAGGLFPIKVRQGSLFIRAGTTVFIFIGLSWRYPAAALPIIEIFAHHLEYRQPARVFNCSRTCGCPIWVGNFRELFALTEMAG